MNPDVVVIGGGFAGISAALELADQGKSVQLFEKKRFLGGRAFSYQDPQTSESIDNGQHLLMGCYHHTLSLLKKLNTQEHLYCQPSLQIDFLDSKNNFYQLDCPPKAGLFGLIKAFMKVHFLSFSDKMITALTLPLYFHQMKQPGLTVQAWLQQAKQPLKMQQLFWEPLCYAALNEAPERASSSLLHKVLEEAFIKNRGVDGLIFPKTGLTELTGQAAQQYLNKRNGSIHTASSVKKIHLNQNRVHSVELVNKENIQPKAVISALPPSSLNRLLSFEEENTSQGFSDLDKCKSAPILSIHLWLNKPLCTQMFLALLNSPIHWIFNRQKIWEMPEKPPYLYSLIISGAHEWAARSNEQIQRELFKELTHFFPHFQQDQLEQIKIIKELEATLSPSPDMLQYRLKQKTDFENFFLAGDWTDTGLPATIESAVLSGKLAAQECMNVLK